MAYDYNRNYQQQQLPKTKNADDMSMVNNYANSPAVKKRVQDCLGNEANASRFIRSIVSAATQNPLLREDPTSLFAAAMIAATLKLEINPNLGFAYIIPYKNKEGKHVAQFQMGYKGFIQLALRTGQYKKINCGTVYADEFGGYNPITGDLSFEPKHGGMRDSGRGEIVGYFCYIELTSGFQKLEYWTRERCVEHRRKFSKAKNSVWDTDFDTMAIKTVVKYTLSHYGILSTDLQTAIVDDQASFSSLEEGAQPEYERVEEEKVVEEKTEEITEDENNAQEEYYDESEYYEVEDI